MLPELHIGPVTISTYYGMMFLGFVLMLALMLRRRERYGLSRLQACLFTVCIMFSGLLGCKVLFVLEDLDYTLKNGLTLGGFSFFGAVFLVPVLMAAFGLLFRLRPAQSVSASAPCVTVMVGTIRVGCFLNGCCGGWTTAGSFRWPTQAMESVGDFVILFRLLNREEKGDRFLYPRFMLAYSILRFLIEFLRDTPKDWLRLSHGQWFAIAAAGIGIFCLLFNRRRRKL